MAGNMAAFINSMLEMRKQNAAAAAFRAEQEQQQAQQIQKAIAGVTQNIGSSLVKYGEQQRQDKMANTLMNEYFGGGGTVPTEGLSFGGAKALGAGGTLAAPGRTFTGGMDELSTRMQMMDLMSKMGNREERQDISARRLELANLGYDLRATAAERAAENSEIAQRRGQYDDAMQAWKASSEEWQGQVKDVTSYNKELSLALSDAAKATTMEGWNAAVSHVNSLHQAAKNQGFKDLAPPIIPPSPDQRNLITEAGVNIRTLEEDRKARLGMANWIPDVIEEKLGNKVPTAEEVLQKQREMQALPGYGYEPGNQPSGVFPQNPPGPGPAPTLQQFGLPTSAPTAGAPAVGGGAPGQVIRRRNPQTGEVIEYRNGKWVKVQ
jgi:hypothetical protein